MLENGVIPIVNENDTISVTELMFTDNDELSGLLATMMRAEALIILSNIDGIYNGNPSDPASEVIREITPEGNFTKYIQTGKSSFGRGGMLTKYNIARKVAGEGINVIIANGKRDGILPHLIEKNCDIPHTTFMANQKKASGVKKWIAHSESFAKGYVVLNDGAAEALASKASSVLLVGITEVGGEFAKGDIVKILNQEKEELGVGIAQYDSAKARENIGKKGVKPFIHYDYLYLD
jgi:glutamate 5-kinase